MKKVRGYHYLFGVALTALIALGGWWIVFFQHAADLEKKAALNELMHISVAIALMLGQADAPPQLGTLHGEQRLEVIPASARKTGDIFSPLVPRYPELGVRPRPELLVKLQAGAASRHLMLIGEGSLLVVLIATCVAMLFFLIRSDRKQMLAVESFISTVTHEMKTPLTGVKSLLQTFAAGNVPREQERVLYAMGLKEVERLEHMVENVLISGRLRAEHYEVGLETVAVRRLLESFIEHRQHYLVGRMASLRLLWEPEEGDRQCAEIQRGVRGGHPPREAIRRIGGNRRGGPWDRLRSGKGRTAFPAFPPCRGRRKRRAPRDRTGSFDLTRPGAPDGRQARRVQRRNREGEPFCRDLERGEEVSEKILLVEDEELVGTMVRLNLESAGYQVAWLRNGSEGMERAAAERFDLILLDIGLPGLNGLSVLRALRKDGVETPVMLLTARSDVPTKVEALQIGADDYLPKPFDVAELLARVNAVLRRSRSERAIPSDQLVRVGEHGINLETRRAQSTEGEVTLSQKEAALVKLLLRSGGKVLTRSDILDEVWGMDVAPSERTVDNYIVRLRRLFEPDPENPVHILTVRGEGYRFVS